MGLGTRRFPKNIAYVIQDGFSSKAPQKKKYLGGKLNIVDSYEVTITIFLSSNKEVAFFLSWWIDAIDYGTKDFTIEIPYFGITKAWNVVSLSDITANLVSGIVSEIQMKLKIIEDVHKVAKKHKLAIYKLGTAGQVGFGVATCPEYLLPIGWEGLDGHDNPTSPNYGNYMDSNGSILVYIPKHYYKWDGNYCSVSETPDSGYVLDRSFINAGGEINGIFVYKYTASNNNGIFASVKNTDPVSTQSNHNPISNLNETPVNNIGGIYKAVKTAGSDYFLVSKFIYSMLARLSFIQGQDAANTTECSYIDVHPKLPKGCNSNSFQDVNDTSVTYSQSGFRKCGLTGSGKQFAKTTHNGQDCGIADLNGNMEEVASGFIRYTSVGFLSLKESVDIRSINNDTTTQGSGGAYDKDLYDIVNLGVTISESDGIFFYGNETYPVFSMSTDRTSDAYKATSLGMPAERGCNVNGGTSLFGNDGLSIQIRDEMACTVGGDYEAGKISGVFTTDISKPRTGSDATVGGRAAYLV